MAQLQRLAIGFSQIHNQLLALTSQQYHYLSRVLRLREGDRFIAMDGLGKAWLATLSGTSAQIEETSLAQTELPVSVTLMAALPKGNGFDDVVRSCTELGVSCIAPVISDRTLLHPAPQKLDRWRRIAAEAAEQSERPIVPTILDPVSFSTALSSIISYITIADCEQYICVARGDSPHLIDLLQAQMTSHQGQAMSIVIATGPEGGWTLKEVEQACTTGLKPVSLGRRILRAVTAPVVALSIVAAAFESYEL